MKESIEKVFKAFNINATIAGISDGPSVKLFSVDLGIGQEFGKLKRIEKNIASACKTSVARIYGPAPKTGYFSIEIEKNARDIVRFSSMDKSKGSGYRLPLYLGVDNHNEVLVQDLTAMPHLLLAGATGSGKSVCLATIIESLPVSTRLVLIDPKKVEFQEFKNRPNVHYHTTEAVEAITALERMVDYMELRYRVLAGVGAKNILEYRKITGVEEPYYVIIIDELSDLMMVSKGGVEKPIVRIAQLARAAGIHLVIGTQRPTREVVTGLIKSNIPARIAFQVASKIDSRVILDESGAEVLLGMGDGIFYDGKGKKVRFQGALV